MSQTRMLRYPPYMSESCPPLSFLITHTRRPYIHESCPIYKWVMSLSLNASSSTYECVLSHSLSPITHTRWAYTHESIYKWVMSLSLNALSSICEWVTLRALSLILSLTHTRTRRRTRRSDSVLRDATYSYMRHDSFICETRLIHIW